MSYETILPLICTSGSGVDLGGGWGGGYSCEPGTIWQNEYGPLVPHVFENGCCAIIYFGLPCLWPPKNPSVITGIVIQPVGEFISQFGEIRFQVSYDGGTTWHSICDLAYTRSGDVSQECSAFTLTLAELMNFVANAHILSTTIPPLNCGPAYPDCGGVSVLYGCVCPADSFVGGFELIITSSAELELPTEPTMVIAEECCCVCS